MSGQSILQQAVATTHDGGVPVVAGGLDAYSVEQAIGKGGYAVVFKGIRKQDGLVVAIKKVEVSPVFTCLIHQDTPTTQSSGGNQHFLWRGISQTFPSHHPELSQARQLHSCIDMMPKQVLRCTVPSCTLQNMQQSVLVTQPAVRLHLWSADLWDGT